MSTFTVIGVWLADRPVVVGVVTGTHDVDGGDQAEFPQGLWATTVDAADIDTASVAAVTEMTGGNT